MYSEFKEIVKLLHEIVINEAMKDEETYKKYLKFASILLENPSDIENIVKTTIIIPKSYDHIEMTYKLLSSGLNIKISGYDCRVTAPCLELHNFTFSPPNPSNEVSFLISEKFNYPMRAE